MAHETIYWHGSSRCWNDLPLSSRRSTAPPAKTSDSVNKALIDDQAPPTRTTASTGHHWMR